VSDLTSELARLGADAVVEALDLIEAGACTWRLQDDASATYAEKIAKADVVLAPDLTVGEIIRRVRASTPQAPARARIAGRDVTVVEARRVEESQPPGAATVVKTGVVLGGADGAVEVTFLKPSGKGSMAAADWARGVRLGPGATWEGPL
jgi:methionyl-tRNA formyltransferase